jgi:hypothetical protein
MEDAPEKYATFDALSEVLQLEYGDEVELLIAENKVEALNALASFKVSNVIVHMHFTGPRGGIAILPLIRTVSPKTEIIGMIYMSYGEKLFEGTGVEKLWSPHQSAYALFPLLIDMPEKIRT